MSVGFPPPSWSVGRITGAPAVVLFPGRTGITGGFTVGAAVAVLVTLAVSSCSVFKVKLAASSWLELGSGFGVDKLGLMLELESGLGLPPSTS